MSIIDRIEMAREARGVDVEPANVGQVIGMPVSDKILGHGVRARQGDPAAQAFANELERPGL